MPTDYELQRKRSQTARYGFYAEEMALCDNCQAVVEFWVECDPDGNEVAAWVEPESGNWQCAPQEGTRTRVRKAHSGRPGTQEEAGRRFAAATRRQARDDKQMLESLTWEAFERRREVTT